MGLSNSTYENIVTEIYLSGGNVGLKNHSKEFTKTPINDVFKNLVVSFCYRNQLPFGLLAEKMSAKHWKVHIIDICMAVWGNKNSQINIGIYIRHSAAGYDSGEAIINHILINFEIFGCSLSYARNISFWWSWPGNLHQCR